MIMVLRLVSIDSLATSSQLPMYPRMHAQNAQGWAGRDTKRPQAYPAFRLFEPVKQQITPVPKTKMQTMQRNARCVFFGNSKDKIVTPRCLTMMRIRPHLLS